MGKENATLATAKTKATSTKATANRPKDLGWGFTKMSLGRTTKHQEDSSGSRRRRQRQDGTAIELKEEKDRTVAAAYGEPEEEQPSRENVAAAKKDSCHARAWRFDAIRRSKDKEKREAKRKSSNVSSMHTTNRKEDAKNTKHNSGRMSITSVESMDSNKYKSYDVITPLEW